MAHPYADHRQHKVEQSRVSHITKGYASGGAPKHSDAKADAKMIATAVHKHEKHLHKGEPETKLGKQRLDRYARGGKVKNKGTNVNIVIAPQGGHESAPSGMAPVSAGPAVPPVPPAMPPRPPMAGPGPMAGPMPPMPMRKAGGRIKSGPAWEEGRKNGTPVEHTDGKNDQKDVVRPRQITYARGGAIEASDKKGPKLTAGDNGEGRLQKAALQRRSKRP